MALLFAGLLGGCDSTPPSTGTVWSPPVTVGGETLLYDEERGTEMALSQPDAWELEVVRRAGRRPADLRVVTGYSSDAVGYTSIFVTINGVSGRDFMPYIIDSLLPVSKDWKTALVAGAEVTTVRPSGTISTVYFYPFGETVGVLTAPNYALIHSAIHEIRVSTGAAPN
jgi:hypothetical protein